MNEQLSNKLLERYPLIFKDYGGDPMKTCMAFGFECGSGWFWIIDALCANIVNSYENAVRHRKYDIEKGKISPDEELDEIVCPYAAQVKEKFGELRFYTEANMNGWSRDTFSMVDVATAISRRTCERCGCPAHQCSNGSWIRTSCTECDMLIMENDYEALRRREQEFVEETLLTLGEREKEEASWK